MGVETLLIASAVGLGLGAVNGMMGVESAEDEANDIVREGSLQAEKRRNIAIAQASQQKVSFLSSGLSLEGTPMQVISSTLQTGKSDVNQIIQNYNTKSSNIMSQARSQAIGSMITGTMTGFQAGGGMNSLMGAFSGGASGGGSGLFTGVGGNTGLGIGPQSTQSFFGTTPSFGLSGYTGF